MSEKGLSSETKRLLENVFLNHLKIEKVVLFGSRAKGTARENSDIDIAIFGINNELEIETIGMELDELPLPFKFDVKAYSSIRNIALCEHIDRVGINIYQKKKD